MGQIIGQGAGTPPALGDLFICDFPWAPPKDDMASMEHPLFTLATRPDRRILRYAHGEATIEVTPSVKGLSTIHDKDVLIFCVSQLVAALNAGRPVSPTLHLKAHDLLLATIRETSGDGYRRLRDALPPGSLGLALDVGHLAVTGESLADALAEEVRVVQIEDISGRVHEHRMIGEGELDFRGILAAFERASFPHPLELELSRDSHRAPECAAEALRRLRGALSGGL